MLRDLWDQVPPIPDFDNIDAWIPFVFDPIGLGTGTTLGICIGGVLVLFSWVSSFFKNRKGNSQINNRFKNLR